MNYYSLSQLFNSQTASEIRDMNLIVMRIIILILWAVERIN